MIFRPSESSKNIVDFYRRYLLTTFSTNNEKYNQQLKKELEADKAIADGPYISMSDPFKKGKKIIDLVDEGVLSKEMLTLSEFHPSDRFLYKHQEEAIRKINEGKNLIVTTGTGSGKTEAFLIPIINQLLKEKENGTLGPGVRTLIIYPMNALVNDQIRRIREILNDMDNKNAITFGSFTGETKEYQNEAEEQAKKQFENLKDDEGKKIKWKPNEIISREKMRISPPNILITNYAMLEYILLRPGDNIILGNQYAEKWKFIVLDEAHSYNGATGIEVATLLKRVKAMLNRDNLQYILTSATLGNEKSNKEIIEFGESLCDSKFDENSIIRSTTEQAEPIYGLNRIDFDLYRKIADKIRKNEKEEIENIISEYRSDIMGKNIEEKIYNIVLHDLFYYDVRKILFKNIKSINSISNELEISVEDFTDFIAVASNAVKNDEKLFEARYHMFLRGIEGIYVTLKPLDKLFIHKMETYKENSFDNDIGYKVFEISFCNNCNALFMAGMDNNGIFEQKSKYYEGYEPDIFLLQGEFEDEDELYDEKDNENIYQICSKCGAIKKASSVNGLQCGHDKKYINKLIKVQSANKPLHKCPCCGSRNSKRSILKPYYLGNEAATSVIATALYGELPGEEKHIKEEICNDDFFGTSEIKENVESKKLIKQFLAFSDSRQTAAFFASYLEDTYKSILVKRIMFEVAMEKSEELETGISLNSFARELLFKFKKYNVFQNETEENILKNAWICILLEMSNFKAKNSLLRNGIIYFEIDYNGPALEKIGLDFKETSDLFKELSRFMMKDSAVDTKMQFTDAEISEFTFSGFQKGYSLDYKSQNIESWCPNKNENLNSKKKIENRTNKRVKYLNKILNNEEQSKELLKAIWNKMKDLKIIRQVEFRNNQSAFQLNIDKIKVKKVKKIFMCDKCKSISPYNVKGKCSNPLCDGNLEEFEFHEQLKNNHYYNLYSKLDISSMIVKEHTAQLSSERAYEYQWKFKNKEINVLSCSTTFEMGVDVGSLETVFMRNMPPAPSNYAQRAGRAGRSLKSAAYAITYCPNSSHDLNYFKNPKSMIEGIIPPPYLNICNEKIVLRHVLASAFSFFWMRNPLMYKKTIGKFVEDDGFDKLKQYLYTYPKELKIYLQKVVPVQIQRKLEIDNFGWINKLYSEVENKEGIAVIAQKKYITLIQELMDEKNRRIEEGKNSDWINYSINTIKDQKIIEFLSKNNIIPKYGFPVDVVELQEPSIKNSHNENISLSRDLVSAISDYAPESEVVADGKLYKSRYIKKIEGYKWPTYKYYECEKCNTLNRVNEWEEIYECKQCGDKIKGKTSSYIIPKFGFVLDIVPPRPVGLNKPERTYKGSISYIGDENTIEFKNYKIGGHKISLGNSRMDSLAVLNKSPFYICETCGYTEIVEKSGMSKKVTKHKSPSGYYCNNSNLKKYSIGHEFQTDVAFIKFKDISNLNDSDKAWTILYSMLEGLTRTLNINRNELSGCLQWYKDKECENGQFGFVLFDNTPGGAGYVKKLENKEIFKSMFQYGYNVVKNCDCGGKEADTACYSCLCNYYNQRQHDILKRKYAIDFYDEFDFEILELQEDNVEINNIQSDKSIKRKAKIKIGNVGVFQEEDSIDEIWNNLISDASDSEYNIIIKIIDELKNKKIEHPIYMEKVINLDNNEEFYVRELWNKKQIMFFMEDDYDDYVKALNTGWKCYYLDEKMNIDEFVKELEVL